MITMHHPVKAEFLGMTRAIYLLVDLDPAQILPELQVILLDLDAASPASSASGPLIACRLIR